MRYIEDTYEAASDAMWYIEDTYEAASNAMRCDTLKIHMKQLAIRYDT